MLQLSDAQRTALTSLCTNWHVAELSFFGSATRADFDEQSDVDLLVVFAPGWTPGFAFMGFCRELTAILRRTVDVFTRAGVERAGDPRIRETMLRTAQRYYGA